MFYNKEKIKSKVVKMENKPMNTLMMVDEIERCETLDDFKEVFVKKYYDSSSFYSDWKKHISTLLREHSLTAADVSRRLGVSKASAKRFIDRIPSKRRNVIMLAMMFGMNLEETNDFLVRWAKYQALYIKNPEDAIWMYMINTKKFDFPANAFETYYNGYLKLISQTTGDSDCGIKNTVLLNKELIEITTDKDFMDWMKENIYIHKKCCDKLISHIDLLLKNESINQWFSEDEALKRDKYYRKIRELKEESRIPERDFLIALGLHLRLGTAKINELLNAAGMGPLLAKDEIEGLVIFFIEELYCRYPSMFADGDDWSNFFLIDDDPNAMDENGQPLEFPADTLAEYVKDHIIESEITFREESRVVELLDLI